MFLIRNGVEAVEKYHFGWLRFLSLPGTLADGIETIWIPKDSRTHWNSVSSEKTSWNTDYSVLLNDWPWTFSKIIGILNSVWGISEFSLSLLSALNFQPTAGFCKIMWWEGLIASSQTCCCGSSQTSEKARGLTWFICCEYLWRVAQLSDENICFAKGAIFETVNST